MSMLTCCRAFFLLASTALTVGAQTLSIDTAHPIAPVSPTLYGLMTEEINFSYDGGLYAEMVRNRTFRKNWQGYEHWTVVMRGNALASMAEGATGPSAALPKSLQLTITQASATAEAGLANSGYWGMAVKPNTQYRGSFYASALGITTAHARLISDENGASLAEAAITLHGNGWQQYTFTLQTSAAIKPGAANHLELTFAQPGSIQLQLVSLFPPTFNHRPNGNRYDLMKMMAELQPHFLRLPGGNYLEGDTIATRFNWKESIGPQVDRPTHMGPWGYQSTDGLGLLEFLEWCEDLHVDPLLAVYAGYSLKGEYVTGKQLEPFVQDALDEIEYVTGDTSTKYGAMRARDGHPAAFPLHYVEIGNEDEFDKSKSYDGRFAQIAKAIRARYPQLKLIATTPVKQGDPDVIDDHYYKLPEEFFAMLHKYDNAPRNGPKIFVGEWATRTGSPTPDFGAALGDAAWMTSMERNADLIIMASYAPLLTNVNPGGMQWSTDLIGYTADKAYASPSYWAQVLFAKSIGDHTVATTGTGLNPRFFWSATTSSADKKLYLKLVNASEQPQSLHLQIEGIAAGPVILNTLQAPTRWTTNSITDPNRVVPVRSSIRLSPGQNYLVPGNSIQVLEVSMR